MNQKKKNPKQNDKLEIKPYDEGPWSKDKTEYSQNKRSIRQIRQKFLFKLYKARSI